MRLFCLIYLFLISSTCFGRFLRPSSGALDCIYSFWYCPPLLLLAGVVDEMGLSPISYFSRIIIIIIINESFYSLWSIGHPWSSSRHCNLQLSTWPRSMIILFFLFRPLLSFATFSSAYLFFYIPEDSSLMRFSLLLLLLCVIFVQSKPISFFSSESLLASVWWFSIINILTHTTPF